MKCIKIGRNSDNDIVIASDQVSRYHAEIIVDDNGQCSVTDHSTNGTMVNGRMLTHSSCYVNFGDPVFFPGYRPLDWNQVQSMVNALPAPVPSPSPSPSPMPYPSAQYSHSSASSGMGFGETLAYFFEHYTDFDGRARRREYWFMVLWNLIFAIPVILYPIWLLATLIPSLALTVRRLHDIGLSGWLILLNLVPGVGSIALIVMALMDSQPKANQWGPSPKYQ